MNSIPMSWNNPPQPDPSMYSAIWGGEPDAVDRLAAIVDPEGEAAQRIKAWEKSQELLKSVTKMSDEIYKRTIRPPNTIVVSQNILDTIPVTCGG
jgi:hypothetical protein